MEINIIWAFIITIVVVIFIELGITIYKVRRELWRHLRIYKSVIIEKKGRFISFKNSIVDLPIVKVIIKNKTYSFIVDTGATNNHLNSDLFDDYAEIVTVLNNSEVSINAAGTELVSKKCSVPFSIRGKEFISEEFLPIALPTITKGDRALVIGGILGIGFIKKYKWILDLDRCIIFI